ncbi:MltA domain protein [Nitrosomonas eutropha C91]|uniref:peptidoglycan lytic exotransglycosylase n=2 Tax=Nitrosomonas eutropha TaxID=916 RepID=A0ABX5M8F6_9PROT|nr:MltA domain protein [Nitrosomonas eutropha C91]PXV81617.1 membrane-bound lytic murein transglycosylase A [Nitrosomonas eutropha]
MTNPLAMQQNKSRQPLSNSKQGMIYFFSSLLSSCSNGLFFLRGSVHQTRKMNRLNAKIASSAKIHIFFPKKMFLQNRHFNRNLLKTQFITLLILIPLGLTSCKTETISTQSSTSQTPAKVAAIPAAPQSASPTQDTRDKEDKKLLKAASWSMLPGWQHESLLPAWNTFIQSCRSLERRPSWQDVCTQATIIRHSSEQAVRNFLENHFAPYQVINPDGTTTGLATGYYEPLLKGSRKYSSRFRYPIYSTPDNLLAVELKDALPDANQVALRGRLQGRKIIPYYTRAEIENNRSLLKGKELLWVEDEVELFFLQIQGSGRVVLENGETVKIGYADHNGYPYRSIGKILIDRGELPAWQVSMQSIKQWGRQNPAKLKSLLQQNARYIFFRELPADLAGPIGALGVPLTAGRSLAIDPESVPLGAPVYLSTTWPNTAQPLNRLMVAQDTGSAIKGGVRADFFWGHSPEAQAQAGKMKQQAQMWVLLPKQYRE